jgi:hypothetical protein
MTKKRPEGIRDYDEPAGGYGALKAVAPSEQPPVLPAVLRLSHHARLRRGDARPGARRRLPSPAQTAFLDAVVSARLLGGDSARLHRHAGWADGHGSRPTASPDRRAAPHG